MLTNECFKKPKFGFKSDKIFKSIKYIVIGYCYNCGAEIHSSAFDDLCNLIKFEYFRYEEKPYYFYIENKNNNFEFIIFSIEKLITIKSIFF